MDSGREITQNENDRGFFRPSGTSQGKRCKNRTQPGRNVWAGARAASRRGRVVPYSELARQRICLGRLLEMPPRTRRPMITKILLRNKKMAITPTSDGHLSRRHQRPALPARYPVQAYCC